MNLKVNGECAKSSDGRLGLRMLGLAQDVSRAVEPVEGRAKARLVPRFDRLTISVPPITPNRSD